MIWISITVKGQRRGQCYEFYNIMNFYKELAIFIGCFSPVLIIVETIVDWKGLDVFFKMWCTYLGIVANIYLAQCPSSKLYYVLLLQLFKACLWQLIVLQKAAWTAYSQYWASGL